MFQIIPIFISFNLIPPKIYSGNQTQLIILLVLNDTQERIILEG